MNKKKKYIIWDYICDKWQISWVWDYILISLFNRFWDKEFKYIWDRLQENKFKFLKNKDNKDLEFEINKDNSVLSYWRSMEISSKALLDIDQYQELQNDIKDKCPEEFKEEFDIAWLYIFEDYWPEIISRTDKQQKVIRKLRKNEKRNA